MNQSARKTVFWPGLAWLVGALAAAPAVVGCTLTSTPGSGAAASDAPSLVETSPHVTPAPAVPAPGTPVVVAAEQSIFRVKNPNSKVALGTRVVIGGPAVQVTATSADTLWIQEAGDAGRCETGNDAVAYRAIVVTSKSLIPELARGQLVEVEGVVTETDGHRTIADAVIRASGVIADPYVPHCDRDGTSLASDALDGVLVLTAGTTAGQTPVGSDGAWSLAPCFGESPAIAIGGAMVTYSDWSPSWHWVRGVITRKASVPHIEPREPDDILAHRANDTCL